MAYSLQIRDANTNAGAGFVIWANDYPFECGMGEACVMKEALDKGQDAAARAYSKIIRQRAKGGGKV